MAWLGWGPYWAVIAPLLALAGTLPTRNLKGTDE
jgi:hypothetical protein